MLHSPGARLGPYEIVSPVGAGGMGEVYKARDTRLERTVAVKVAKEQFEERFRNEALAIAALNHPHICSLFDVGSDYLVMEYVEGAALRGPLPVADVLRLAGQIADALEHAHRQGIVHRDLKPSNILLTRSGIKVLDFGLAKRQPSGLVAGESHPTLTVEGAVLGTPRYMAPEQIEGKPADERSDIFAFGLLLYEMLTGQHPFEGEQRGQRDGGDPRPRARADLGPEADDAAGAGAGGADLPGQGPGGALAVGPRAEACARVGLPRRTRGLQVVGGPGRRWPAERSQSSPPASVSPSFATKGLPSLGLFSSQL